MYKSSIYQHMIAYVYNNGQFIFQMSSFAEAKPSVAAPAAPAAPAAAASGTAEGASGAAVVAPWASFPKRNKALQYKLLQVTTRHISCVDDIFTYFYIYLYIQMIAISSNALPLLSLSATVWLLSNITSPYFSSIADRALTFSRLQRTNKPLANQTSGFNTFFIPFSLES